MKLKENLTVILFKMQGQINLRSKESLFFFLRTRFNVHVGVRFCSIRDVNQSFVTLASVILAF